MHKKLYVSCIIFYCQDIERCILVIKSNIKLKPCTKERDSFLRLMQLNLFYILFTCVAISQNKRYVTLCVNYTNDHKLLKMDTKGTHTIKKSFST